MPPARGVFSAAPFKARENEYSTCICAVERVMCICSLSPNTESKFSCDEFWFGETLLKGVTVYHTVKRRDRNSLYMGDIYQRIHAVKLNRPCCRTCEATSKINLQIQQQICISAIYNAVICKRIYKKTNLRNKKY